MAVSALSQSADHAPRLAVGRVSDEVYASLLGGAPRVLKKKPVLVLDADELAQAHLAIAMGGAQILEAADDPVAAIRPRTPSLLLGLAPVGAPDDWDPGFATLSEPDEDWEPLADSVEPDEAEELAEDDWDQDLPDLALDLPAELPAEPEYPSIEDQLARMRHLTQRADVPVVEEVVHFEPEPEPEPILVEPDPEPDVFTLSLAAVLPPEPEPQAPAYEAEFDDSGGPDLSWMQPKERRELVFSHSDHSALRARLVNLEAPADDDFAAPSLWDRLRGWWARLLG